MLFLPIFLDCIADSEQAFYSAQNAALFSGNSKGAW